MKWAGVWINIAFAVLCLALGAWNLALAQLGFAVICAVIAATNFYI